MARPRKPLLAPVGSSAESLKVCRKGVRTVRGAAEFTGTSRSAIWQLIHAKTLPSFKIASRRVIPVTALIEYLASMRDADLQRTGV